MLRRQKKLQEIKITMNHSLRHTEEPIFQEEESALSINKYLSDIHDIQQASHQNAVKTKKENNNLSNKLSSIYSQNAEVKMTANDDQILCLKKANYLVNSQTKPLQDKTSFKNITQRPVTYIQLVARRILSKNKILKKKRTYYYRKIKYRGTKMTVIQTKIGQNALVLKKSNVKCKLGRTNYLEKINEQIFVNKFDSEYQQSVLKILNDTPDKCRCLKSQCKKQYCECFQSKRPCGQQCQCVGCLNKNDHKQTTKKVNFLSYLGCSCQKNQCSTSYCRCRKFNINCSQKCGCCDKCQN